MPFFSTLLSFVPVVGPAMDIGEGLQDLHEGNGFKGALKLVQGVGFGALDVVTLGTVSTAVSAGVRLGTGATKVAGKMAAKQALTVAERKAVEHIARRAAGAAVVKGCAWVAEEIAESDGDNSYSGNYARSNRQRSQSPNTNRSSRYTSTNTGQYSSTSGADEPPMPPNHERSRSACRGRISTTTISRTATEALRKVKETNGIDPYATRVGPILFIPDRQNPGKSCVVYKYRNKYGEYIYIRKDNAARYGNAGGAGDQGPHFNVLRSISTSHPRKMENYREAQNDYYQSEDSDLGQHHYFREDDIGNDDPDA